MTKETNENAAEIAKAILDLATDADIFGKTTLSINMRIDIAIAAFKIDKLDEIYAEVIAAATNLDSIAYELREINRQIYFKK